MEGTEDDAIFGDDVELDIDDTHPYVPVKPILRIYLKIQIMTWILNDDW